MSIGMKESAEESDLECLSRPERASARAWARIGKPPTENHFAAVQDADDLVPRSAVRFDLEELWIVSAKQLVDVGETNPVVRASRNASRSR